MPRAFSEEVQRNVITMADNGYTDQLISFVNNVRERTARNYKKKLANGRLSNNYSNCGPRPAMDEATTLNICLAAIEEPFRGASDIRRHLEIDFSVQHINMTLRRNGLKSYHAAPKTKLDGFHRRNRVAWATIRLSKKFLHSVWRREYFELETYFSRDDDRLSPHIESVDL